MQAAALTDTIHVATTSSGVEWIAYPDRHTVEDVSRMIARCVRFGGTPTDEALSLINQAIDYSESPIRVKLTLRQVDLIDTAIWCAFDSPLDKDHPDAFVARVTFTKSSVWASRRDLEAMAKMVTSGAMATDLEEDIAGSQMPSHLHSYALSRALATCERTAAALRGQ